MIKLIVTIVLRCALFWLGSPEVLGSLLRVAASFFAKRADSHGELNVDDVLDLF